MSDTNGLISLHYASLYYELRLSSFASHNIRLQDPKVGQLVVAAIKKVFKEVCGIELKPDEKISFGVPILSMEEQRTITIGQIAEKKYQLFFRFETADGTEFCPISRELKIYQQKYAEITGSNKQGK